MKKTTLFLIVLVVAIYSQAQRISNLTVEGISSCVPFAAFNPTNNSETALGDGQMIFTDDVDLSNVTVNLNVGADAFVEEPNPLPTNWSSTVGGIKVTMNNFSSWAKYNITLKKIKPAALPLEIKTGAGNFDSNSWTPETEGWAGACIDKNQSVIRFGGAKRSFMVAFTDAPDSLIYTIKFLATPWNTSNVFDIDGSADGVNWTSIVQYNATNPMPLSSPTVVTKLKISGSYRYIRWVYTTRAGSNVALENITVTKDTTTGTSVHYAQSIKLYPVNNQSLRLESKEEVKSLSLYNVTGSLVFETINPAHEIRVGDLSPGIYISEIKLKNGHVVTKKFIL